MQVRDYMTTEVFTVNADKKLLIAREIMEWATVRHVPVVDEERRVVGLVSHRDLLRVSLSALDNARGYEQKQHLGKIRIKDVMRTDVRCIDPDAPIQGAAHLMRSGHFGCLPVVDHRDRLLGIITEHDLLGVVEGLASPV